MNYGKQLLHIVTAQSCTKPHPVLFLGKQGWLMFVLFLVGDNYKRRPGDVCMNATELLFIGYELLCGVVCWLILWYY
jgi:hypothetical protein